MCPGRSKARAMAMRCACPSLRPPPCSLSGESMPSGSCRTKSAQAVRRDCSRSASEACGLPISRLSRMVPLKSVLPCGTYTKLLRVCGETETQRADCTDVSWISPSCGVASANSRRTSVVFPRPVSPTTAVQLPAGKVQEKRQNTGCSPGR